jgi:hypothetical protein
MRFVLFTDNTVSQCMSAINKRLQASGTRSRPELDGWIEKPGKFSLAVTSNVFRRFPRTTRLSGVATRESGTTVIRGHVSGGVGPRGLQMLVLAVGAVLFLLIVSGRPMLALVTLLFGGIAYVPLRGDFVNSETLLIEVEKTLKATPKPPK